MSMLSMSMLSMFDLNGQSVVYTSTLPSHASEILQHMNNIFLPSIELQNYLNQRLENKTNLIQEYKNGFL